MFLFIIVDFNLEVKKFFSSLMTLFRNAISKKMEIFDGKMVGEK